MSTGHLGLSIWEIDPSDLPKLLKVFKLQVENSDEALNLTIAHRIHDRNVLIDNNPCENIDPTVVPEDLRHSGFQAKDFNRWVHVHRLVRDCYLHRHLSMSTVPSNLRFGCDLLGQMYQSSGILLGNLLL